MRLLPDHLPLIGSVAVMSWITKFLSKLIFIKVCQPFAFTIFFVAPVQRVVQELGICEMQGMELNQTFVSKCMGCILHVP